MAAAVSGYVNVQGASLYYEMAGDGGAVVLLHAAGADQRMWDEQVGPLAHAHTLVRYDRRGSGRSIGSGAGQHTADLKALLDRLELPRAALLGAALGGRIALDFAIAHPDAVRALILVDPPIDGLAADALALVPAPALLAVGELAGDEAQQTAATLEAAIPDAWTVTVPGAGRMVNQDAPQRFNDIVAAFLAETERKSRR